MRDILQEKFANEYVEYSESGILYLCPRFGKCRVGIKIFQKLKPKRILIAVPDLNIKKSWNDEFKILKFEGDVVFTTFLSLHKYKKYKFDLIVIDEIHLLSEAQIDHLKEYTPRILGLTGTLASDTEYTLREQLNLEVISRYSITQAIKDGIICDYEINIVTCKLDSKKLQVFNKRTKTEKAQYEAYSFVISKLEKMGKETLFMRLARMRLIQSSIAKIETTKKLLEKFKDERVLIFCGQKKIADSLGCNSYHSSSDNDTLTEFAEGNGNHLAVVKLGNTGITYKPLSKVIINYFDSNPENLAQKINRCMAMEYGKHKSSIWIVSTDESVELKWLKKALQFFDPTKIKYYDIERNLEK